MAVFDVAKIMDILAKQEADGYTFYEEAAGKVGDDKAGMLFERLAKDERKHEAFYKKQRAKYEGRLYEIEQEDADFIDILLSLPSPIDEAKKIRRRKSGLEQTAGVASRRASRTRYDTASEPDRWHQSGVCLGKGIYRGTQGRENPSFTHPAKHDGQHGKQSNALMHAYLLRRTGAGAKFFDQITVHAIRCVHRYW